MGVLSSQDVLLGQNAHVSSTTAGWELGTRGYTRDGRAFRYVKAGVNALVAGHAIQSPAFPTGQFAKAVNTTSGVGVGALTITMTCGSSVAAGFYNDGILCVASGAGQGGVYQIKTQAAAVSTGATGSFTLYDDDPLAVAITTTSTLSLFPNRYNGVIDLPAATATGIVVGVAVYPIGASEYGWIQTWGPGMVLAQDTTAMGAWIYGPSTTAGGGSGFTAATLLTGQAIGHLMQAGVAAQYVLVDIKLAP